MSHDRRFGRASLFDLFRSRAERTTEERQSPPRFDLTTFYATREKEGTVTRDVPSFSLREGLPDVPTVPPFADPIPPKAPRRAR